MSRAQNSPSLLININKLPLQCNLETCLQFWHDNFMVPWDDQSIKPEPLSPEYFIFAGAPDITA